MADSTTRTKAPKKSKADAVIQRHDQYMTHNYPRWPIAMASGSGCRLTDADGKTYLDLFSGFGAGILGHCHEDLVTAATKQATKLWHVGNLLHTEPQTRLAEQISEKGFGGRCFFSHSGADANEAAIKLARLYGKQHPGKASGELGRYKVISTTHSFHGRGFATMGATGSPAVRQGFEPLLRGFVNVAYDDIGAVKKALDDQTVAIIAEPIQGEGGINVPADGYFKALRKLCDDHDLLLIADEVWTGCGRTGKWFAYQHWGVEPDVMTLGKAVGCGLPVGAMCAGEKAAALFDFEHAGRVTHATTLGGNCVSMAVAARMFEVIERDELVERAALAGERIKTRLRKFAEKHPAVVDVRGRGLFIGIELDPEAKRAWFDSAADVVQRCVSESLLINATQKVVLRLAPPLIVSDEELDRGLSILEKAIKG